MRKLALLLSALTLAAVGLAACGGDDETTSAAAPTETSATDTGGGGAAIASSASRNVSFFIRVLRSVGALGAASLWPISGR